MSAVLAVFLGLLILVTIGLLVVFYYMRKGIRYVKRMASGEMTEEEFQRMANKHFGNKDGNNQGPQFDKDYFKGAGDRQKQKQQQQQQSPRTTRTADGLTITDNRHPDKASKKIFAQDEGEYVEFTEE